MEFYGSLDLFSSFVRKWEVKINNEGFKSPHQLYCAENMPYSSGNHFDFEATKKNKKMIQLSLDNK